MMACGYLWVLLRHLSFAIVFVGAAVFEVLVLEWLHGRIDAAAMQNIEQLVMMRVRRFMPIVVLLLFASDGVLFDLRCNGISCMGERFGYFLLAKVFLALCLLTVFVNAAWDGMRGRMTLCRFRYTHRIVLALMAGIVFLDKTVFFL